MIRLLSALLLAAHTLVPAALRIPTSGGPWPILQPARYEAPSGEYVLDVNPSSRDGAGPGEYRMTRNGELVWAKEFPVTLWQAEITDRGYVGGYAYSSGYDDYREDSYFHVLTFSPAGEVLLDQATKRTPPRGQFSAPDPHGAGVLASDVLDRLVVRVVDSESYGDPIWKAFRLSTGEVLADVVAERPALSGPKDGIYQRDARAVPGIPLTLVWWFYSNRGVRYGSGHWACGGVYSLHDCDGRMVWSLDRRTDYSVPDSSEAQNKLKRDVQMTGTILDVTLGGRFALWFVEEKQRVEFTITPVEGAPGWKVERGEGVDFNPAIQEEPAPPPKIELQHLETVELRPATDTLHAPGMRRIDRRGRILVMDGTDTLHAFDCEGRSLFVGRPEDGELMVSSVGCLAVDAEGHVYVPHYGRHLRPPTHLRFDSEGQRLGWVDLGSRQAAFDPRGTTRWVAETPYELSLLDEAGERLAILKRRSDRHWFRSLGDFDVSRSGMLVLIDEPQPETLERGDVLVLCDPSGVPRRTIKLPMVLGAHWVRASEHWIVAGGRKSEQLLIRVKDGSVLSFDALGGNESSSSWCFGFSPDEKELWAVEARALKLHRYALPTN